MADTSKPNMKPLDKLASKAFSFDQSEVFANRAGWKGHSTAVVIEFPENITTLNLTESGGGAVAERIVRLAESFNRPESIKVDYYTKTPNGGIVPGIVPGVNVGGIPCSADEYFDGLGYTMVMTVRAG